MSRVKCHADKTVYIVGSISGNPDYKKHFDRVEKELRELGAERIVNPTVLPVNLPYESYAPISMAFVQVSDVIVRLEGWKSSKGARAEVALAEMLGKEIVDEECTGNAF